MPNTFSINQYQAKFSRFFMKKESIIFLFMEFARTNYALWLSVIFQPDQVLVDQDQIERFVDMCNDMNIAFIQANGAIFIGKPPHEDDYYERGLPYAKYLQDNRAAWEVLKKERKKS